MSDEAESDFVEFPYMLIHSPVLITFSTVMELTIEDDDLRWKMAYIQNNGKELN